MILFVHNDREPFVLGLPGGVPRRDVVGLIPGRLQLPSVKSLQLAVCTSQALLGTVAFLWIVAVTHGSTLPMGASPIVRFLPWT